MQVQPHREEERRDEARRLDTLRSYRILDSEAEREFDDLVALAAQICETPVGLFSLVDERRQWFKAAYGTTLRETEIEASICAHTIEGDGLLEIADATTDGRTADNPLVKGEMGVRFYAGVPLEATNGVRLGALCVLDTKPRHLNDLQRETLRVLGDQVMARLELRRKIVELQAEKYARSENEAFLQLVTDKLPVRVGYIDREYRYRFVNGAYERAFGLAPGAGIGKTVAEFAGTEAFRIAKPFLDRALAGDTHTQEFDVPYPFGHRRVEVQYNADHDRNGEVRGIVVHVLDVTERFAAQQAIQKGEERLRIALKGGGMGTWDLDLATLHMECSETCRANYGRKPEDSFTYEELTESVVEEDFERWREAVNGALVTGSDFDVEYGTRWPDGTLHRVQVRGSCQRGADGSIVGLSGVSFDVTDRSREETRVREGEARYRTLFETIEEGFCVLDMIFDPTGRPIDYRFREFNPAFTRFTGITPEDALGGRTAREIYPTLEEFWFETYGRVAQTGEPVRFENWAEAMGKWFEVHAFRIGEDGSREVGLLFKDVTERRREESARSAERARQDRTLENAQVATFDFDVPSGRVYANPLLARFFGVDEADAYGGPIDRYFAAIHPEDRETTVESINASLASGLPYETQYRVVDGDGRERWVLARGDTTLDPDGLPIRLSGVVLDVSERVRADEARRESDRRVREAFDLLEGIVEGTSEVVVAVDCDFRFVAMNDAFRTTIRHLFGRTPELGENLLEVLSNVPEDHAKAKEFWGRALAGEEISVRESFGDEDLARSVFDLRFYPIRNTAGAIVGAAEIARDVTERVNQEAERERLLVELEVERKKLETLFRIAPAFIAVLRGRDLVFEYVNDAYYSIVGHRTVLGRPLVEAVPETIGGGEGQDYDRLLLSILDSGKTVQFSERPVLLQRTAGGPLEERFLDLAYQPLREPDGTVSGVLVHGIDVTEGVLARRRVEESEAKYRTLFTSMGEGYCVAEMVLDDEGRPTDYRFVEVNDAFERLTGIPLEAARSGRTIRELVPEIEPFFIDLYGRVALSGKAEDYTQYADALRRWFEGRVVPLGDLRVAVLFNEVTERERLVAELAQEREKFATVLAMSPNFVTILRGRELVFEYANPSYERLLGNRPLIGLTLAESQPEAVEGGDLGQAFDRLLRGVMDSGETLTFSRQSVQFQLDPARPPEERILDFVYQPLRDANGTVTGVLAQGSDVTEQALAEREIAQREELFRTVFEQAPDDAILVMDLDRTITAWNPAAQRICGWSADEAIGQPADLLFTLEDREARLPDAEIVSAAALGKADDERWHLKKDGSRFWGIGTMNALHDDVGNVRGYLKVFRDATERYVETRTLAFLRLLTDTVIDQRDPDAIIETAERMLGEYLGATRVVFAEVEEEERVVVRYEWSTGGPSVLGSHQLSEYGPSVVADLRAGRHHIVRDAIREYAPGAGREAAQAIGILAGVAVPLMKDGRLVALFVVQQSEPRDWTDDEIGLVRQVADRMSSEIERARAETALRYANLTLEARVEERTAELQKSVQEAEGFNYSISHDLRTPLRAMVSTASILVEELGPSLDEEHKMLLQRQAENAKRMGRLIDELLRLSRLARVPVNREPLDMTRKARSVAEEIRLSGEGGESRVEVQDGMTATGDAGLVRTVFHNLIGNACKFSPSGGTVWVGQSDGTFFVRDEGVGFDIKYASKIFMPFERLVLESEFPGTGIGLANVKRIVERHGGRVWAESVPGEGATFWFTLE